MPRSNLEAIINDCFPECFEVLKIFGSLGAQNVL